MPDRKATTYPSKDNQTNYGHRNKGLMVQRLQNALTIIITGKYDCKYANVRGADPARILKWQTVIYYINERSAFIQQI